MEDPIEDDDFDDEQLNAFLNSYEEDILIRNTTKDIQKRISQKRKRVEDLEQLINALAEEARLDQLIKQYQAKARRVLLGSHVLPDGTHKGKTIASVMRTCPEYVRWLARYTGESHADGTPVEGEAPPPSIQQWLTSDMIQESRDLLSGHCLVCFATLASCKCKKQKKKTN